jgi:hypothetical protein
MFFISAAAHEDQPQTHKQKHTLTHINKQKTHINAHKKTHKKKRRKLHLNNTKGYITTRSLCVFTYLIPAAAEPDCGIGHYYYLLHPRGHAYPRVDSSVFPIVVLYSGYKMHKPTYIHNMQVYIIT